MPIYKCISCGKIKDSEIEIAGSIYYCPECINRIVKMKIKVKENLVQDAKNENIHDKYFELIKDFDYKEYIFNIKSPPKSKQLLAIYEYLINNYKQDSIVKFPKIIVELIESNAFKNLKRKVSIKQIAKLIEKLGNNKILIKNNLNRKKEEF